MFTKAIPTWDQEFAEIDLHYKSGKRYHIMTTVADARARAKTAVGRKSVVWVKVTIPNPNCTKARVCIWSPPTNWSVGIVDLPKTKD